MKRKPVPPAPDADGDPTAAALDRIRGVRDAVPLVPKPEDDCCRRLVERASVPDRGTASAWLVFLSALGVVTDAGPGYARVREDVAVDDLAANFQENVFLASDVVAALDPGDARTPADVFADVRDRVPGWERAKRDDWEEFWTGRVERRLDWAAAFGLAERVDGGYRRTPDAEAAAE